LKLRVRLIGVVALLALALIVAPTAASAAPAITQGVRGTVTDSGTGLGIPFALLVIQVDGGAPTFLKCDYDGTYSLATPPSADVVVTALGGYHMGDSAGPLVVTAGAVTVQDFSLDRSPAFRQAVYRFFNMRGGVHFYTANDQEFMNVYKNLSSTFHYDGVAYTVPWGISSDPGLQNPNTFPLYRFYNKTTGVHFFTMSEQEKANVIATRSDDYVYEGVAYWVSDRIYSNGILDLFGLGGMPVHRFYMPARDAHFFTANSGEIFGLPKLSQEYQYEGVGFYINGWRSVETDSIAE